MNVLGLPGKNPATASWMQDLLTRLTLEDVPVVVQHYKCWELGTELDLETELERAKRESPELVVGSVRLYTRWTIISGKRE